MLSVTHSQCFLCGKQQNKLNEMIQQFEELVSGQTSGGSTRLCQENIVSPVISATSPCFLFYRIQFNQNSVGDLTQYSKYMELIKEAPVVTTVDSEIFCWGCRNTRVNDSNWESDTIDSLQTSLNDHSVLWYIYMIFFVMRKKPGSVWLSGVKGRITPEPASLSRMCFSSSDEEAASRLTGGRFKLDGQRRPVIGRLAVKGLSGHIQHL